MKSKVWRVEHYLLAAVAIIHDDGNRPVHGHQKLSALSVGMGAP
jgi:hypothetical protein